MSNINYQELKERALWVRRKVLEMAVQADSGHVSTAMSQTELLVALYFGGLLRHNPKNPYWEGRDHFLLSKGQGGIGLYPVLAAAGYFPESDLDHFTKEGSHLGVHAEWHVPGIEIISGSLGHGLPIATGLAAAFKQEGKDNLVFCLTGDGELHEGSNWEAMLSAAWFKLGNLVVIVDRNGQCTLGKTDDNQSPKDGVGLDNLADKFRAFDFAVREIDGHDLTQIIGALQGIRERPGSRPLAIIAHTKKGKGLSPAEDKRNWHYQVPKGKDLEQCWEDLGVPAEARPVPYQSQAKHTKGMRDRFWETLFPYFQKDKNLVVVTADNGAPSLEPYAAELPGQYYQVGIAEQEMVGMATGLALAGKQVFCYAIAPFVTTRVHEFLKLDVCAMNLPITMVGVGAGFAYDIMCVTHHTVEDIAIMRALPNMRIYAPADGPSASWVAEEILAKPGPSYVRLDRGGLPDIYKDEADRKRYHEVGHLGGRIRIAATGVMVHNALQVAGEFPTNEVGVLDTCILRPLDSDRILRLLKGAELVVTLEEHQLDGGLGSIISELFTDNGVKTPLIRIAVPNTFSFELGGREAIWRARGLDVETVVRRIKERVNGG